MLNIMHVRTFVEECMSLRKKYEKIMSLSPRCVARSHRSRALIILVGKLVMVKLGLLDVGSSAILVVPKMGGKGMRNPLAKVVEALDSVHSHPRPR
jgi:hypothetical protein